MIGICKICKKDIKIHCRGLCIKCYERERGRRRMREIRLNPIKYLAFRKRNADRARNKRIKLPEVKDKERLSCKKWYSKNKKERQLYYQKYYNEKYEYHLNRPRIKEVGENYLKVRERANGKCEDCGKEEALNGKHRLHVHHEDKDRTNV